MLAWIMAEVHEEERESKYRQCITRSGYQARAEKIYARIMNTEGLFFHSVEEILDALGEFEESSDEQILACLNQRIWVTFHKRKRKGENEDEQEDHGTNGFDKRCLRTKEEEYTARVAANGEKPLILEDGEEDDIFLEEGSD